jgi:hypothetical protein
LACQELKLGFECQGNLGTENEINRKCDQEKNDQLNILPYSIQTLDRTAADLCQAKRDHY